MTSKTTVVTDWRVKDEDLPDVLPDCEHERVITPQKHVVLCRVLVGHDFDLTSLQIGKVEVPFELDHEVEIHRAPRAYRPACQQLIAAIVAMGARPISADEIWIPAGMDIRVTLRNEGTAPARPRAALLVQEEVS